MTLDELRKVPLTEMKGIGSRRAELFYRQGVQNAADLLSYFPREYLDERSRVLIVEAPENENVVIRARLVSAPRNFHKGRLTITNARIEDESGRIGVVWYNQPYLVKNLVPGEIYLFEGRVKRSYNRMELVAPKVQKASDELPGIVAIYPLGGGLTQKMVRAGVQQVLSLCDPDDDPLPPSYRQQMPTRFQAYTAMHRPASFEEQEKGRERLVFDELFIQQLALRRLKRQQQDETKGIALPGNEQKIREMIASLPYKLTLAQQRSLSQIRGDLASSRPMNRLLQGDVGSGKTVIAFIAMYQTFLSGYQSALMVPTEVLASQHFQSALSLLGPLGMKVALLTGSLKARERREILQEIESGQIDAVIGTHALLSDPVQFHQLGLVITDEQHRFGVRQRLTLSQKGQSPNVLVMTATPIPRTLAMILFGDMDISAIDELPPGRTRIRTFQVDRSYDERLYAFIRRQVSEGHQVYIICAAVDASEAEARDVAGEEYKAIEKAQKLVRPGREEEEPPEKLDLRSAVQYHDFLQSEVFPDLNVALLHGQMKNADKEKVMREFAQGKVQILVSTTVVEVGVNVPNATLMIVENAERFGLSQLHQLRGRVGRGKAESYCVLVTDSHQKLTRERLKILVDSGDGFYIAEQDLKLRGSGDVFGLRQHGLPDFKLADLYRDTKTLYQAQVLAQTVMDTDPDLKLLEHRGLKTELDAFWEKAVTAG